MAEDDPYWASLKSKGYEQLFSSSYQTTVGAQTLAYGFKDTHLSPELGGESGPEICRLAFYSFDGTFGQMLGSTGAPTYPKGSRYTGYPVGCTLAEWDEDFWSTNIWGANFPLEVIRRTLGLRGSWSDINQNGYPELGVLQWYCPNACHGYEGAVHFYEIRDGGSIVDLVADFPGVVLPWKMLQSVDTRDLYVFDPTLEYEPHVYVDTWWIYSWNGTQYENVSSNHLAEYQAQVTATMERLKAGYGQSFGNNPRNELDILSVLFTLDKAGNTKTALEEFLKASDPKNWPGTGDDSLCWLQYVRASAQDDYDSGRAYKMPLGSGGLTFSLPISENYLRSSHDLSACKP